MSWILVILAAYLFFALFSLGDKLIVSGPLKPRAYTFYVAALGVCVAVLMPFTSFGVPSPVTLVWLALDVAAFILGLYYMFLALEKFDVSTVMPAIGALQPIIIFAITRLFLGGQALPMKDFFAFATLLLGTFIIANGKKLRINREYIVLTTLAAGMFALDFVFSKFIFDSEGFLRGLIWRGIFSFVMALGLLASHSFRREIFSGERVIHSKKMAGLFLFTQATGALANILQSLAISLAPVSYLAVMNSLRGVQYVFLFAITLAFSWFFPRFLREDISAGAIIQKTIAIFLIVAGLAMLVI